MINRFILIAVITLVLVSCNNDDNKFQEDGTASESNSVVVESFQQILDQADVNGSILLYDVQKNAYFSNDFDYAKQASLPASTFKIANSIIALQTSVVESDSSMFYWNGEKRKLKAWEQDLDFKSAFHYSCVPCYQDVAKKIGVQRMNKYLQEFNYGNMVVDSNSIDNFWLEGESSINQFQQIAFLMKFYNKELNISERTYEIMKEMLVIYNNDELKISGKTGWAIRNGNNKGWFVGYLNYQEDVYFFAVRIEPNEDFNMDMFSVIRSEVTFKTFEQMGITM